MIKTEAGVISYIDKYEGGSGGNNILMVNKFWIWICDHTQVINLPL